MSAIVAVVPAGDSSGVILPLLELDDELELAIRELTDKERTRLAEWLESDLELAADSARGRARVRAAALRAAG